MMEISPLTLRLFEAITGNHVLLQANHPVYTVLAVTDSYLQIATKTKDSILGKGLFENFPSNPDDPTDTGAQALQNLFMQVIQQRKVQALTEHRYDTQNKEGIYKERYWKTIVAPVPDARGEVEYLIQTVEEITARAMAEKLVKAHESLTVTNRYLQQIINLVRAPLQVLEPVCENGEVVDFRYKLTNAAYSAYADTTPESLQDKKVGDVFPGYFKTSSFTNVAKTFKTGIADEWEIHYDVDGLDIYNKMNATKMDGEVVVHFTEITDLKNLQHQLEGKVAELERSNQSLEEFAHAASHDLKEPIRKIHVFTGQLKSQLANHLNETEQQAFAKIENAAARMSMLIDDLLLYSQVSLQPMQKEPVDLTRKVQRVLEDLEVDIQERRGTVQVGSLPVVQGFKRQLQQLLQNLISNALKYCRADEPPCVCITADKADKNKQRYDVIKVQDNGIGFEQKHAEKIFQLFTRLHGKGEYSGTGIGLSIVKKVVENHQGFIEVESTPGKGSAFKIFLPAE